MKKKIYKNTTLLIIGTIITKILSFIIKITISKTIGINGLGTYMLIFPTILLILNISNLGIPLALIKLISEGKSNNKNLLVSTIPIIIITNTLLFIIINIISKPLSVYLLHTKELIIPIKCISLILPFTTISSIIKSYFFGKEKIIPHVLSNITEDLVKLILIITILPKLLKYNIEIIISFIILSNIISEFISIIVLLIFLPKHIELTRNDIIPNKNYIKKILNIGIPNTLSNLIGSITLFLEPIIITTFLLKYYNISFITKEYGIITGYILPIISLPTFIISSISQIILPILSKEYSNNNIKKTKVIIKRLIQITLLISITINIFIFINRKFLLKIMYNTNKGLNYLNILLPISIIHYLEIPFNTIFNSLNKSKINLKISFFSSFTKLILLSILTNIKLNVGLYPLIITEIIEILLTFIYQILNIKKISRQLHI